MYCKKCKKECNLEDEGLIVEEPGTCECGCSLYTDKPLIRPYTQFEMNKEGWFRIRVDELWSEWQPYSSMAFIEADGWIYFGVSDYYSGYFPTECVNESRKVKEVS